MKTLFSKNELRKFALEKRKTLVSETLNCDIVSKILNLKEFIEARNVALYFPIKNEIDITSIVKVKNKNFYFPRCCDLKLEFCKYSSFKSFVCAKYGIYEPVGEKIDPKILDVIFIPALMANKSYFRLGYGKGYYDRFFKENNVRAKKILVLPFDLISEDFVEDDFDVASDMILCEK